MENTSLQQQLLEAGVHFGHLKKKWNPKMLPSRKVGAEGLVVSFEPSLREFVQLVRNLERNRCENVMPFMLAIGSQSGMVKMSVAASGHSGLNHLSKDGGGVSDRKSVV